MPKWYEQTGVSWWNSKNTPYLGCGEGQLVQTHNITSLGLHRLVLFLLQQVFEGVDQLQVGGGGDVVVSSQLI